MSYKGIIQVFGDGKRIPGAYIKVFNTSKSKKDNGKFYVDGYTDIAGKFKYALSDLKTIGQFSILIVTDLGSVVKLVNPPKGID